MKEDFIRCAVEMLDQIHHNLLERATAFRNANITPCDSPEAFHAHWAQRKPRLAAHPVGRNAGAGGRDSPSSTRSPSAASRSIRWSCRKPPAATVS